MAESAPQSGDPLSRQENGSAEEAGPIKRRGFFRRHWIVTTLTIIVVAPAFVFTLWAGIALSFSYSEGTRTGFVQKLSRKGWVCKTWEGEMAMTAQPGVAPTLFAFTVRNDSVASAITAIEGKQVTLSYEEHQGVPSSCFGETGHFVTGVRAVNP
jgi:hypothetical protein